MTSPDRTAAARARTVGPLADLATDDAAVSAEIAALEALDHHGLVVRWRHLTRRPAPDLPKWLILRLLAYRLQADAYGDLDPEAARFLKRIVKDRTKRRARGETLPPKAPPPVPPVPVERSLKPGSVLVRTFGGTVHRVTVTPDGFAWNGTTYRSLSEIARAITGTRWSGPRFFGLREDPARNDRWETPS